MEDEGRYLGESLRKIAKGAGVGFIGSFIGIFFGYISRVIIARWLGPSDYGLISLGFAAMTIGVTISLVGLPQGTKRYIGFYKGRGDRERIKGTIISALKISFPISIILAISVFLKANWIAVHVFNEPNFTPVLRIFCVAIPFMVLSRNFIAATVGFQDLRYRVYVNNLFLNIFKLIAIVIFLFLGYGVLGAAWGWAFAVILMPFLAFYFLEKRVFSILDRKVKSVSMKRELFSFSFPLIFAGWAGLIMSWTDTLMLGYFSTAGTVGIYNAAMPTAKLLKIVLGSVGTIFMPVVSELYSRNAIHDLKKTYGAVTKWIFSLVMPLFLLMVLFSNWILKIMFGSEFVVGSTALSILAFGYLIICIVGPTGQLLQAYGRTRVLMGCSFIGAGTNIVLNYFLIQIYGLIGAALATSASLILVNIIHLLLVYRITKMQPFGTVYLKPLFASLISVSIVYVITRYLIGVSFFSLIGMFFVFLFVYFLLLLILRSFGKEDLTIMRAIDQRLGTKSSFVRKIIKKFL